MTDDIITYIEPSEAAAIQNKNPSRIFPSDFDKLSETLEDIIEGRVASQGQPVQVRERVSRELRNLQTTREFLILKTSKVLILTPQLQLPSQFFI